MVRCLDALEMQYMAADPLSQVPPGNAQMLFMCRTAKEEAVIAMEAARSGCQARINGFKVNRQHICGTMTDPYVGVLATQYSTRMFPAQAHCGDTFTDPAEAGVLIWPDTPDLTVFKAELSTCKN